MLSSFSPFSPSTFTTPLGKIALARVKGRGNKTLHRPCQDFAAWTYQDRPSPSLIISLADGAGSSKFSAEGSYLSVYKTLRFFKDLLKTEQLCISSPSLEKIGHAWIQDIQQFLKIKAYLKGQPLSEFATTLMVFIAFPQGFAFFQIGDGFGVVRSWENSDYHLLLSPQKGHHINETNFITSSNAKRVLKFCSGKDLPAFLALATDGIENVALKNISFSPYAPFFKPLESFIMSQKEKASEKLTLFLSSERFDARSSDDRTLFLAAFNKDL